MCTRIPPSTFLCFLFFLLCVPLRLAQVDGAGVAVSGSSCPLSNGHFFDIYWLNSSNSAVNASNMAVAFPGQVVTMRVVSCSTNISLCACASCGTFVDPPGGACFSHKSSASSNANTTFSASFNVSALLATSMSDTELSFNVTIFYSPNQTSNTGFIIHTETVSPLLLCNNATSHIPHCIQRATLLSLAPLFKSPAGPKWSSVAPMCTAWYGVDCTQDGALVSGIRLGGMLQYNINTSSSIVRTVLADVTTLTVLDLSDNGLVATLPLLLGDAALPSITSLNLSHNNISGAIPSFIFTPALRLLNLGFNALTGSLPSSIQSSISLSTLILSYNHLNGPILLPSTTASIDVQLKQSAGFYFTCPIPKNSSHTLIDISSDDCVCPASAPLPNTIRTHPFSNTTQLLRPGQIFNYTCDTNFSSPEGNSTVAYICSK